jgi:hypothetical protein
VGIKSTAVPKSLRHQCNANLWCSLVLSDVAEKALADDGPCGTYYLPRPVVVADLPPRGECARCGGECGRVVDG